MSLRLQINVLIASLIAIFIGLLLALQVNDARSSVREEIEAGNRVATQLLSNFVLVYADTSRPVLVDFLIHLGRVRATVITLRDKQGSTIYSSPPSAYKSGREAPAWYAALIAPESMSQRFDTFDGVLEVAADPSRAILDGWDDAVRLLQFGALAFVIANILVFWFVRRATRPLSAIAGGLDELQRGVYHTRLPTFSGAEVGAIAQAFNRMAQTIEDNLNARRDAIEATLRLEQNRELATLVQTRVEEERRDIARELHDEIGQSVTAIKSLALSLKRREQGCDEPARQTAQLIVDTASGLYAAMHEMIPRLRPLTLDSLGLADAIGEQIAELRRLHPAIEFDAQIGDLPEPLGTSLTLAVYRILQEAVTNALRHAQASRIAIALHVAGDALLLDISDDGRGLAPDWQRPGHYGVHGMTDRARALGGTLNVDNRPHGGVRVATSIPLH
jgi:two-component system, NarL family, sensor histidine kinase UhpB